MKATQFSRKLDGQGRLMIPIRLREQVNLTIGKEYNFFIHEENGHIYICVDCGEAPKTMDLEEAKRIIQENGLKIVQNDD